MHQEIIFQAPTTRQQMAARRPSPPKSHGAQFFRAWRKSAKLTQRALGALIGRSHAQVSKIERGEEAYNQETLEAWAKACGATPAQLLSAGPGDRNVAVELLEILARSEDPERALEAVALLKVFLRQRS